MKYKISTERKRTKKRNKISIKQECKLNIFYFSDYYYQMVFQMYKVS